MTSLPVDILDFFVTIVVHSMTFVVCHPVSFKWPSWCHQYAEWYYHSTSPYSCTSQSPVPEKVFCGFVTYWVCIQQCLCVHCYVDEQIIWVNNILDLEIACVSTARYGIVAMNCTTFWHNPGIVMTHFLVYIPELVSLGQFWLRSSALWYISMG